MDEFVIERIVVTEHTMIKELIAMIGRKADNGVIPPQLFDLFNEPTGVVVEVLDFTVVQIDKRL